jgi:hypothetical protein
LSIRLQLPFVTERTDVLTCQSETDIENINLIATLLSHYQTLAYWKRLGGRFVARSQRQRARPLQKSRQAPFAAMLQPH